MPVFEHENLSLFYRENGSGQLLLILPGNTSSSICHGGELDYFGQDYHALSLDFRGTGKSQRLASWPEDWWVKCADDAAALINHLGKQSCLVMGTSGGGNIALLVAIKHPDLVSGVIADSCAEIFYPEDLRREVANRKLRTKDQIKFWQYAHGDDWEDVVKADSELLLDFADSGGDFFKGSLNTIQCPVLFTASLEDTSIPDIGQQQVRMAQQIENSTVFLRNAGDHPLMWTCPAKFRSAARNFLIELRWNKGSQI